MVRYTFVHTEIVPLLPIENIAWKYYVRTFVTFAISWQPQTTEPGIKIYFMDASWHLKNIANITATILQRQRQRKRQQRDSTSATLHGQQRPRPIATAVRQWLESGLRWSFSVRKSLAARQQNYLNTGSFKSIAWLQIDLSQLLEQLQINMKYQYGTYQMQIHLYFIFFRVIS